ncbi:Aldo-keto reductase family 4 member C8 [Smittium culicis]|uniref:Aldo-keto reductase family 4 member C8 n=1 Tax=Smittium culicis TaxID=133412 RepID=A0A1R1XTK1_9FUNG|nr:Aldo-keto reductase family 4 member C8 [Smittium culicis]
MGFIPRFTKLRDGLTIPTVGLGIYLITDKDAIKIGYRHTDTAAVYNNEEMLGEVVHEIISDESLGVKRNDVWITSKLPSDSHGYDNTIKVVHEV